MDIQKLGLVTTLLLGAFILIGAFIAFLVNKKEKVVDFSLGLAFGVITMLIITDLLPETIEHLGLKYIYLFLIFAVIGYGVLKILDHFIPDHEEENRSKKEANANLVHIGIITSCALVLHNIIEGMAIYSTIITEANLGVMMTIGVGFHNIPLGMVIAGTFYQSNQNMSKTVLSLILVSLSTFVGGLILFFLDITMISPVILGILLSVTLGMLLFITFDGLLPRIRETKNKKTTTIGIAIGAMILLIAVFI